MGSNKNKRRSSKFGLRGGAFSKVLIQRKVKKNKKISEMLRKIKTAKPYQIKKSENFKMVLAKLSVKKATKFQCLRNINNRLIIKQKIPVLDGYRIVNVENLKSSIMEITSHCAVCKNVSEIVGTGGESITLQSEKKDGFSSILSATCKGCNQVFNIDNSSDVETVGGVQKDINVRAVWGSMVTGGGCSSLNELMGTLGVPGITEKKNTALENEIGEWWKKEMEKDMIQAGIEEKEHAIATDSYFEGVPSVTIICDGGWCKRSHKHTYNAMAGVGVIFGAYSKKLLHIGIRNKLCYICSRAETQSVDPPEHQCFKNWDLSSQSMESDILLEGFLQCEKVHGVRYMKMIADGDSSVYATVTQQVPVWGPYIKKLECANHSCKCLRTNLEKLVVEKPQYKGKGKLTLGNRVRIVMGVRAAIRMRSKEEDKTEALQKLRQDIKNCGKHVLGIHDQCSTDFCKHKSKLSSKNTSTEREDNEDEESDIINEQCSIWQDVLKEPSEVEIEDLRNGGNDILCRNVDKELLTDLFFLLNRMADKADRLLGNFTSNLAESWMHIRCKFDGGKMTNKCFKGSFYARCYGSALRSAEGPAWSPVVYGKVTGKRPDSVFINTYRTRASKYHASKKAQQKPANRLKRLKRKYATTKTGKSKKAKADYGEHVLVDTEDVSTSELERKCTEFYQEQVLVDKTAILQIEKSTTSQSESSEWKLERRKRLTSSNFGEVMSRNVNNNVHALTKRLLYTTFKGNKFTMKGLSEEKNARIEYVNLKNKNEKIVKDITLTGLVIDETNPFLAASSDGIVQLNDGSEGLIEIKNLLQTKVTMITEAALNDNQFCLKMCKNELVLKENHKFMYQIQGQLNILNMNWCDLVIRRTNPYDIVILRVHRDANLWTYSMVPKLKAFYFSHILPELSVPRYNTITGIRKPAIPWFTTRNRQSQGNTTSRSKSSEQPSTKSKYGKQAVLKKPDNTSKHREPSDSQAKSDRTQAASSDNNVPGTSSDSNVTNRRRRQLKVKFVGRRINHNWEDDNGTEHWYQGTVTSVVSGTDGDPKAVYEVYYDHDDQCYDVDNLLTDYIDGSLKFADV